MFSTIVGGDPSEIIDWAMGCFPVEVGFIFTPIFIDVFFIIFIIFIEESLFISAVVIILFFCFSICHPFNYTTFYYYRRFDKY